MTVTDSSDDKDKTLCKIGKLNSVLYLIINFNLPLVI